MRRRSKGFPQQVPVVKESTANPETFNMANMVGQEFFNGASNFDALRREAGVERSAEALQRLNHPL